MGDYSLLKSGGRLPSSSRRRAARRARARVSREPAATILAPRRRAARALSVRPAQVLCPLCEKQLRFNAAAWAREHAREAGGGTSTCAPTRRCSRSA